MTHLRMQKIPLLVFQPILEEQRYTSLFSTFSRSSACIELVRKNSSNNRVFTLGIGSSADRHLVKGMARAGMGTASFTTQGEPITAKVINQLKNALQPCISEVSVKWGKGNHFEGASDGFV